jgi:ornithine cyclodeaminase/alanine dehydrogenase-like protein (mu-crystallin family)
MHIFDASRTAAALPYPALIAALRERFAAGCEVPARHVHELSAPGQSHKLTSLLMPAWVPGQLYGVKVVNIAPGNNERGLPGLHGSYLLFDAVTGQALAVLDGNTLTTRRTAAASALAASFLAPAEAHHLLVLGAGAIARELPAAYAAVRPIDTVRVWARKPEAAEALAADWRAQGWAAEAVSDLAAACGQADVVSCATHATAPLVHGEWLAPGSHLDLIGSFTPAMREADDACLQGARLFVDTEEALKKSGDLLEPLRRGVISEADVRGTLTTLCKGVARGRMQAQERTVFKSVGTALEDLAAATLVWQTAQA